MLTVTQWRFILALLIASSCRVVESKVFERCELAKVLRQRYRLDLAEVAQWVCIAQHSSGFNAAAQAFSPSGGSHGLFQISDVYWCSPPGQGAGCNLPCHKLRDDNLNDDLYCVKRIYEEHHRISGDGYMAWNAYPQFCKNNSASYIQDCFPEEHERSTYLTAIKGYNLYRGQYSGNAVEDYALKKSAKVYGRCELARELHQKHKVSMQQIPTWVCIAEHESRFNTAAVGRLNADGSADHGLFQISDLYWCAHDSFSGGKACGLSCNKLLDNDITDDVLCVKRIHNEHIAISGDGFTAWTVYKPHCQNQLYEHIENCFKNTQQTTQHHIQTTAVGLATNQVHTTNNFALSNSNNPFFKNVAKQTLSKKPYTPPIYNDIFKSSPSTFSSKGKGVSHKGKVYTRCSLAQELFFKHNFPMQDISTWVCIAEHESQFNTAAIGRLNTDGSADHGLFQISDRYWCDHNAFGGKACNLPCGKLLDDDLRDDVACLKTIHEEHTRISGDGFNAWTVYRLHCQNQHIEQVKTCFDAKTLQSFEVMQPSPSFNVPVSTGKIYSKCELAQELYHKHHMLMEQIPKWVCIAQYESLFNTGAVGRLNTDGSADHGLFQISDLYWCTHDQYGGKACNIPCHKLLDSDITDDVRCIKIIHEEHTRISGDGFNAWTVYQPHCRSTGMDHIKQCFTDQELEQGAYKVPAFDTNSLVPLSSRGTKSVAKGKIYKKCELAQELYRKHLMPMEQIPKWICIAQHESSYNTAAVGRLNRDGSADHGLFQISDLYWCSHNHYGGKACNIPCDKLLDSDITDDVKCIKIIHDEHTRISGDGFNAWTVYKPHCRYTGMSYIKECFTDTELTQVQTTGTSDSLTPQTSSGSKSVAKGKIYKKCELAQELFHKHRMPMEQIPKWVCIAQHESSYNTSAVGRLNTDGSADHGLFQISNLYWCTHDQYGGKACNIPCDKLLDSDITDDVRCIKIIHEEHTRISGDGFNAWTVYKPHCRNTIINHIKECFTEKELKQANIPTTSVITNLIEPLYTPVTTHTSKGKIYKKCELAQELLSKHKMPMKQIPTWICVAQHESSFNTAAVGRLNVDGSLDHGLFQISDLYWCSHDRYGGKTCNIPCEKLLDSDITDDVRCIKIIHEEHTRISGDGFNAWTVYKPHCRNRKMEELRSCFTPNQIEDFDKKQTSSSYPKKTLLLEQVPPKTSYSNNPFLNGGFKAQASNQDSIVIPKNEKPNYTNNPFLQNIKISSDSEQHKTIASTNFTNTNEQNYQQNALSNGFQKPSTAIQFDQSLAVISKPNYKDNPFLNGAFSSVSGNNFISKPVEIISELDSFKTYPFLSSSLKLSTTVKPTQSSLVNNKFIQTTPVYKNSVTKNYLNSNDFRTTTTLKPKTTATKAPTTTARKATTSWNSFSTTKSLTTKKPIITTTRKSTTKKPATISNTTKRATTTSKKPTTTTKTTKTTKNATTWSWENHKSTTTKPKTSTTWSWQNEKYQSSNSTKSPRTTNTWKWQNQKYTNNATLGQSTVPKSPRTTTIKPERSTWNWRNAQKSTTVKHLTTTANWQKWDKPSTISTNSATTTTTRKAPNNWWSKTTKPIFAQTTKPIRLDNHKTTTLKPQTNRPTTTKTTRATTTNLIRFNNNKITISKSQTNRPYNNDNHKTTTLRPRTITTKLAQQKFTISKTTRNPSTTKTSTNTGYSKYKNDPQTNWPYHNDNYKTTTLRPQTNTTKLAHQKTSITTTTRKPSSTKSSTNTGYSKYKNDPQTNVPYHNDNHKTTTLGPQTNTTKLAHQKTSITTTTRKPSTTKSSTYTGYSKYKNDPQTNVPYHNDNHKTTTLGPQTTTTKLAHQKTSITTTTRKPSTTKSSTYAEYNAPVILTLPHMLGASNEYTKTIRGLNPDAKKHQTFVDVQHLTGVPLQGGKRVQFNMFLKSINRISITENLTTVLMPAIWVEEGIELNGEMVTFFKKRLINTLKTLNVVQWAALFGGIGLAGICLIYYVVRRRKPAAVVEAPLK